MGIYFYQNQIHQIQLAQSTNLDLDYYIQPQLHYYKVILFTYYLGNSLNSLLDENILFIKYYNIQNIMVC